MQWVPARAVSLIGQHGHIRSAASSVRRSERLCGRPSAVPASGPNLLQRARGTPYPPAMKVVAILALLVYTVGTFGFAALLALWWRDPDSLRKRRNGEFPNSWRRVGPATVNLSITVVWFAANALAVLFRLSGLKNEWT